MDIYRLVLWSNNDGVEGFCQITTAFFASIAFNIMKWGISFAFNLALIGAICACKCIEQRNLIIHVAKQQFIDWNIKLFCIRKIFVESQQNNIKAMHKKVVLMFLLSTCDYN